MPPVTFIAAEAFDAALVAPVPRRARPGDLLLAVVLTTHTATLTLPAGWEQLAREAAPANAAAAVWLCRHRIAEDEPADHAFAVSAGNAWGVVALYRGLDEAPAVATASSDLASATTHAAPSVTPTTYSDLRLCVWATFAARTWTPPGGATERIDVEHPSGGVAATIAVADILHESKVATGAATATASSACTSIACSFLLAATPPPRAVAISRSTPGGIGLEGPAASRAAGTYAARLGGGAEI